LIGYRENVGYTQATVPVPDVITVTLSEPIVVVASAVKPLPIAMDLDDG
jgi:hypothetical protein